MQYEIKKSGDLLDENGHLIECGYAKKLIKNYDRNAIITMNGTNFIKLINGKLDPVLAFTAGKLKIDGDVGAALELIRFIK